MILTDYTTYNEIRAALGVSDDELDDATLALNVYSAGLEEDLFDVSPSMISTFTEINEKDEGDRSDKERRVLSLTRLFATYSVAKQLGTALPMFSPKSMSDGKASMSRFSGEPYKDVLKGLSEQYDLFRGRLVKALEDLSSSVGIVTDRTMIRIAVPAFDPVTGI